MKWPASILHDNSTRCESEPNSFASVTRRSVWCVQHGHGIAFAYSPTRCCDMEV